jgi:FAD:protein FMN transferase
LKQLLAPLLLALIATHANGEEFVFHHENVLGTSAEFLIHADSRSTANEVEQRILAEIDRVARIVSTYDAGSEMRRWIAGELGTKVSPELFDLLVRCDEFERLTGGAFNPRVGSASVLWKAASKEGKLPDVKQLQETALQCARAVWKLDASTRQATILDSAPATLTFDAIAKGYIIDKAIFTASKVDGVTGVVVNIGGDLRIAGKESQQVSIGSPEDESKPIAVLALRDKAVATSGNYLRFFEINGRQYSHIIDPRSARPVDHSTSVSVIADTAAAADAAATALSVMSVDDALKWCDAHEGYSCLILDSKGKLHRSCQWPADDKQPTSEKQVEFPVSTLLATADEWPREAKLNVSFELNKPDTDRYRRPYVAVWIEDADGLPVRTLILWLQEGRGARWHRDLKRWFKQDQVRQLVDDKKLIGTVSGATRAPGSYKAVWDGTDDQGKFVKQGKYTLYIEAAREHGTYQLTSATVAVGAKKQEGTLKGNAEIKSAAFKYQP